MDWPLPEDGASETVEARNDDISRAGRTRRKPECGSIGSGLSSALVEDGRHLGSKHCAADGVLRQTGGSPACG